MYFTAQYHSETALSGWDSYSFSPSNNARSIMRNYLSNRWIKIGLAFAIFGWGPLWIIVLLASIGPWPDPNPNPIGPGLLFFFTFWPAVACLITGILQVRRG